jgi:hypothetical protein
MKKSIWTIPLVKLLLLILSLILVLPRPGRTKKYNLDENGSYVLCFQKILCSCLQQKKQMRRKQYV